MSKILILFPCDYFNKKAPDIDYKYEFDCCVNLNKFYISTFDYDKLINQNKLELYPDYSNINVCIYRGWMLKDNQYTNLYNLLKSKNITLINSTDEYIKLHMFPNIYNEIKNFTPKTIWFKNKKEIDYNLIKNNFDKFIIKDFVKSEKNTDFPLFFDNSIKNINLSYYIDKFIKMRGNLYTGGIVFKQFVNLKKYSNCTNEIRVFYLKNNIISISRNSNQSKNCNKISKEFVHKFTALKSNFYTVDFAELENGNWIIIETGDGQVSGLSSNQSAFKFYEEISKINLSDFN